MASADIKVRLILEGHQPTMRHLKPEGPIPIGSPISECPGPYRGKRNNYKALSEYWAKRSRFYENVLGHVLQTFCLAQNSRGMLCNLPPGHKDAHYYVGNGYQQ